jgi:hypothetical protein
MEYEIVKVEEVENRIIQIREASVMTDTDLAIFFEVETGHLNERVKRNIQRFPDDFRFQLTKDEQSFLAQNYEHLAKIRFSPIAPYVYTYAGALTLAFILRSDRAIAVGIAIARAFENFQRRIHNLPEKSVNTEQVDKLANLYYELQAEHKLLVRRHDDLVKENQDFKQKITVYDKRFEMIATMFTEVFDKLDETTNKLIAKANSNSVGFKPSHLNEE